MKFNQQLVILFVIFSVFVTFAYAQIPPRSTVTAPELTPVATTPTSLSTSSPGTQQTSGTDTSSSTTPTTSTNSASSTNKQVGFVMIVVSFISISALLLF